MRPKIVLPVLVLGLLAVALAVFFRPPSNPKDSQPAEDAVAQSSTDAPPAVLNPGARAAKSGHTNSPQTLPADGGQASSGMDGSPEEQHKAYVEARVSELQDLSANNDKESLQTILSELTNRDPEVRKAAIEAAKQFGSRDAIPGLQDALAQTDDQAEKTEINEAIEFLTLPSLTEVRKPGGAK